MVTNKIAESISARSTIGDLRRKCDKHEEDVEKWKRKTQMLQKMCSDLNTVMKRYILDVQNKQDNPTPIKITRSVGLQVCYFKILSNFLKIKIIARILKKDISLYLINNSNRFRI